MSIQQIDKQSYMSKLEISFKNFQLFEKYQKMWYSSEKDKKTRLGVFFKATLKQ